MARHTGGWFKIWRVTLQKDLFQNIYLWSIWHALLHMAVWKETQIIWNGKQRVLKPGSCVFGIKEFAERWECSQRTVSKWLHYLHDTQRIVLESCSRGTIATIRNWELYQATEDYALAPTAHEVGSKYEPSSNQVGLSEEVKKGRREEIYICLGFWEKTLSRMGVKKSAKLDEGEIARLIQRHGFEKTRLALLGAGFEAKTETYDPTKHVSIRRLNKPDVFEKFVNLGAQHKPAQEHAVDWDLSRVGGA